MDLKRYFKDESNLGTGIRQFFSEQLQLNLQTPTERAMPPSSILKDIPDEKLRDISSIYFGGKLSDHTFQDEGDQSSLEEAELELNQGKYASVLVFGVELQTSEPTRSRLAEITRWLNRKSLGAPVAVIFRYDGLLAFSNGERTQYIRGGREGEKVGKVAVLRDIDIIKPHPGHSQILSQLKVAKTGKNKIETFEGLYQYWQEVFSVSLLNKKFYLEISNWYFWAINHVVFPGQPTAVDAYEKDKDLEDLVQEHKATHVIRMLTRLLFVWFIKEKKLVPEALFELKTLQKDILKNISPFHETGLYVEANKESVYYKAILQNLFFATLNCPIEGDYLDTRKRGFRGDGYGTHRGIDWLMRYKKHFKDPDAFLAMVNGTVPFLNGGLFECLDDKTQNLYIDGFSDQMTKGEQLIVPDYLFFGAEEEEDLSKIVGISDAKYKKAAVKGLINILKSYKFTITENTPIEEDVALDPELLGKVFENLLASYNPETKTTARKQTGSFYTPREIVNYMVDESLIAFLKNAVVDWRGLDEESIDHALHALTSFENTVPFDDEPLLQKEIITALSSCTILDPACGSGAFPMGILQKMVHILQKLDPDNKIWKDIQLHKAEHDSKAAFEIEDKLAREERLIEINEAFDQSINDPDYARKLFLIENCIYGVDIQPIATQISKLRFFISLVVEQKVNREKSNFGIRPLPNLETKFVAANTLIGIEKPNAQTNLFDSQELKDLENLLKKVRSKLFSARTKETKLKYRDLDKSLREDIANKLKSHGWQKESAEKLAGWDPYDQNASSPFFDPEWMFDIQDGFDIITGNPPWGAYLSNELKQYFKEYYPKIDSSTPNSFAYFIGEAVNHSNGIISFVLPDSILIKDFEKTRGLIRNNVYEISWYLNTGIPEDNRPFVYVEHDVCVLLINRKLQSELCCINKYQYDFNQKKSILETYIIEKSDFIKPEHDYSFNLKIRTTESNLYSQLESFNVLSEILQCHEGIHTGNSRDLLFHNSKINSYCKPLYYGGRAGDKIRNYVSQNSGWFVDYRNEIIDKNKGFYASLRDERIFMLPKIYITRTGNPLKAFYDENNYASNNFFSLQLKNYKDNNEKVLKAILPLILSKFSNYYIRVFAAPRLGDTFIETKIFHILKIPYPNGIIENRLVKLICDSIIIQIDSDKDSSIFQNIMDSVIFNLYFHDHMKERCIDVLEFVERNIAEVMLGREFEDLSDAEKYEVINQLNAKWCDTNNEVMKRISMFKERSPEILKVILES